jgi:hypothetical protein
MRIGATAIPPLKSKANFQFGFCRSQPMAEDFKVLFVGGVDCNFVRKKTNATAKVLLFFEITKKNKEKSKKICFLLQMYKKNAIFARYLRIAHK